MKTIHIRDHDQHGWLLKELYHQFLKTDSSWHFVYWENGTTNQGVFIEGKNLLVRVSDSNVEKITQYLKKNPETSEFEIYDFPFPKKKWQLGLLRRGWEAKHPRAALPMLHAIAEARMTMRGHTFKKFLNQFFHIGTNCGGLDHVEEAQFHLELARGNLEIVKWWYREIEKRKNKK